MNFGIGNKFPDTICEGCLSSDRKLKVLQENAYQQLFMSILDVQDYINYPVSLCWECVALIRRMLRFKQQVKSCRETLISYMFNKTSQIESVSNLKIYDSHTISEYEYEVKHKINGRRTEETEPLTFIKIEDDDFDNDNSFYIDENKYDEKSYMDDSKMETNAEELDSVPEVKKYKSKRKNTKQKTKMNDFNESDDEPLTVKKKRIDVKEYKPRTKRKKNEGPKIDRRKNPAPKMEKPAGVVLNARVLKKLQELNVNSEQLEMVVLSWDEVEAERQKALSSVSFTRHEYRCHDCVLGFNHRFKLDNHMKKHDPNSGTVVCEVCKVRCKDKHALVAHKRRHRVRWRCRTCGDTWSRAAVAADHHAREHAAPPPTHRCSVCAHRAQSLAKLRNHMKNHAERQRCELCGKTFRDRSSLRTHLFIHKGEKEYSCPHCQKKFLFKKAMEIHLVTHDAHAHLYCYECDVNFKNRMSYYQHMKYNLKHIDPAKLKYACNLCDKKFAKAMRLHEHNIAVHLKTTPIRCSYAACNFACSSRPVLRTHVRMVHRNAKAVRNHVCDVCGKAYTTKKILEGHMRSHTGERPFVCSVCPSSFRYEAALYNHTRLVHRCHKKKRPKNPQTTVTWEVNTSNQTE